MANVDTFGLYVTRRLEEWGREFALHRDCEYLGHKSKDMLQLLIEHKGEMPPRVTGFKPIEIPPEAEQIESIIADMARADVRMATVMRAYYCGSGRRLVERREQANAILSGRHDLPRIGETAYRYMQASGFNWVRGLLIGLAQAA